MPPRWSRRTSSAWSRRSAGSRSALGDGVKRPRDSEIRNIAVARKSLVAARALDAGETLCAGDIASQRPGSGRPPIEFWSLIGTRVARPLAEEDPL